MSDVLQNVVIKCGPRGKLRAFVDGQRVRGVTRIEIVGEVMRPSEVQIVVSGRGVRFEMVEEDAA